MPRPMRRRLHWDHHHGSSLLLRPRNSLNELFLIIFSAAASESTSTVRLTIMVTSTVGADAATETSSVRLPSDDTSSSLGTMPPTSSFPIATTMTMTMTKEPAGIECLDERDATPKPYRYLGSGSRCQIESSSACASGLVWWEMIPMPPALLLWLQSVIVMFASVYAFATAVLATYSAARSLAIRARGIRTCF
jgi:hypothetical protein